MARQRERDYKKSEGFSGGQREGYIKEGKALALSHCLSSRCALVSFAETVVSLRMESFARTYSSPEKLLRF